MVALPSCSAPLWGPTVPLPRHQPLVCYSPAMLRKIALVIVIAAAVLFGLWRLGLIDKGGMAKQATELKERAKDEARDAAKSAGDAAANSVRR